MSIDPAAETARWLATISPEDLERAVAALHGATITCTRAPTGGARFSFRLVADRSTVTASIARERAPNTLVRAIR